MLTGSGESTLVTERSATAIVAWLRLILIDERSRMADKRTKPMIVILFMCNFPGRDTKWAGDNRSLNRLRIDLSAD